MLATLKREHVLLLVLVVATAIWRAIGLGDSSLEHLEASYLFEAIKPESLWKVLTSRQSAEQMHQPLYPLLLRGWVAIGGVFETWLRLPSLVFSVACIPIVWALARRVGEWPALAAAALTATAPLLHWYGRDASPYALLALLSLGAFASAASQIDAPDDRRRAIRTAVLLSLAFYTHFHGAWVAITVGLWLLRVRSLKWTVGVTAALCLPWTPALLYKLSTSIEGLERDQTLMRYSHDLTEALPEAARLLVGGEFLWPLALLVVLRTARSSLGKLVAIAVGVAIVAELHILWQLHRSKGILYVDVRHYLFLGPLLMLGPALFRVKWVAGIALALQLWTSIAIGTIDKPDVRAAMAYLKKHATGPAHGVAYLPAPWYEPIVELYLTGPCERLVHAHSREGWWSLDDCFYSEFPVERAVYGFPPSAQRLHWAARRTELELLWIVDIRDHRFGLKTPPTTLQEQWHCWTAKDDALVRQREFDGVTLSVYDARRLQAVPDPPAPPDSAPRTVTSEQSWELPCRNRGINAVQ